MSNGTLATSLLMGAVLVEFGLASISGPSFSGSSEPPQERVTNSIHYITAPGEVAAPDDAPTESSITYPTTPVERDGGLQSSRHVAIDRIIPPVTLSGPPAGYEAPRADIANDIDAGVRQIDRSVRELPGYTVQMVAEVEKHGIAALAYENPEMKRTGQRIGRDIGAGIGHLINALGKDMVDAAARR